MKWLFRPSVVILVSAALVAAAVYAMRRRSEPSGPMPLPVADADTEVVWLYPATSTAPWDRFVDAVRATRGLAPGVEVHDDRVFPTESTGVPEIAVSWPGSGGRLVFRWYKLVSGRGTHEWVQALLARRRKPLAVIGGSNSKWARELALELRTACQHLPEEQRPLLLLTTATADYVRDPDATHKLPEEPSWEEQEQVGRSPLHTIYPGRTFRFSFTNRQMATAITRFIWSRDDLRPDADPVYPVRWDDDDYSKDLLVGYWRVLRARVLDAWAEQWAWTAGGVGQLGLGGGFVPALAGGPFPTHVAGRAGPGVQLAPTTPLAPPATPLGPFIASSVGGVTSPNPFEADAAREL